MDLLCGHHGLLSSLICLCCLSFSAGIPSLRPTIVQGTGFSLGTESALRVDDGGPLEGPTGAVQVDDKDGQAGSPVADHWSCRQVRQKLLDEVPKSQKIAVLIPFREQSGRERHRELAGLLETLLPYAEQAMRDDGASFKFFVVEQSAKGHFNRGALMDVGFHAAQEFFGEAPFTVVAQDCDFVPDERMIQWYSRSGEGPIHLASYVYCPGFGGVTIFQNSQYLHMDGYSHSMWGWGGEDDDAMDRWMSDPSHIVLAPSAGERFKDLGKSEDKARDKSHYDRSMRVWKQDNQDQAWVREGLAGLKYTLLSRVPHDNPMVEHIVVELGGASDN